ncbi:cytochrome b-c1 complex subunit 2, mitochondrial-like [Paramacrobiotus metropolitanus]|uniref:cytochrome b-c1 complex subunit 2, mitochondrial-like n=1 Tax=Paramacrobiotus metropolitanus TaxID=2943436 RepID=UPI00244573AF|nr:cytochrome b-c1 complex subunit 2, mitochondrial-like [Paramacrobiotus metropolitanus]
MTFFAAFPARIKMFIAKRGFAKLTDAAKAAQSVARPREPIGRQVVHGDQSRDVRVTRLPNDLTVISEDSNIPVTRVVVAVKAGARHEPPEVPGLSHALRNAAPLGTRECSAFGLSRNMEQLGASLSATTTRDHIIYTMNVHRNHLPETIKFLGYVVAKQEFKRWEVKDAAARLDLDLDIYEHRPDIQLMEHLHAAAYRDGLANSLFAPRWAAHHYDAKMLREYVQSAFKPSRMAIAVYGARHEDILNYAADNFKIDYGYMKKPMTEFEECAPEMHTLQQLPKEHGTNAQHRDIPAKYGGGQCFHQTLDHLAYAAVAVEGAGINNPKEALALSLLQQFLGSEPSVKWSNGQKVSPLAKAAAGATREEYAITGLNICHSDSGLFGFTAVAHGKDIAKVVQAGLHVLREGKGVDLQRLQEAKNKLVAKLLMHHESRCEQFHDMAIQALSTGNIMSVNDAVAIVDQIRPDDLAKYAQSLVQKGTFSMAAVGNLSHLPRLDEFV